MTTHKDRFGHSTCRYKFYILAVLLLLPIWYLSLNRQPIVVMSSWLNQPPRLDIQYVQENLESLDQTDPQLIEYVRARHLSPPSKLPYRLTKGKGYYKDSTVDWVLNFFRDKRNGIFIEVGAQDGEQASHTLYLEKEKGWTGLLIECNPTFFAYARSRHRNAWMAHACLSFTPNAGILNFSHPTNAGWYSIGTLHRDPEKEKRLNHPKEWTSFDVETVPLYTLLAAVGLKEIDYFSFDIEGGELAVLKTLPFEEFIFKVLIIETIFYTEEETKELDELVQSKGYHFVRSEGRFKDFIYVHNSVKHLLDT